MSIADDPVLLPPAGLRVEDSTTEISIEWPWFRREGIPILAISIVFTAVSGWIGVRTAFLWPWFTAFFLCTGAIGITASLAILANRTSIRMRSGWLTVRQGPFPWPSERSVPVPDVMGIRRTQTTAGCDDPGHVHALEAILRDGSPVTLLSGFERPGVPNYVRHLLLSRLPCTEPASSIPSPPVGLTESPLDGGRGIRIAYRDRKGAPRLDHPIDVLLLACGPVLVFVPGLVVPLGVVAALWFGAARFRRRWIVDVDAWTREIRCPRATIPFECVEELRCVPVASVLTGRTLRNQLHVTTTDGRTIPLVTRIADVEVAPHVRERIESHLRT